MVFRASAASAAAIGLIFIALSSAIAAPSVGTLSPAVIRGSQAPHGFDIESHKVFAAYSTNMAIAGHTCSAGAIKPGEWKQGLHQVFKRPWPPTVQVDLLEICGYLFTTNGPAITNYNTTLVNAQKSMAQGTTHPLKTQKIGDAVIAAYAPPQKGTGVYIIVFRYRNALLGISYLYHHKPLMTTAAFVHMAAAVAQRLEKSQ
jgi:hypothetical protein